MSIKRVERLHTRGKTRKLGRIMRRHRDAAVRRRAVLALRDLGDPASVDALHEAARHDSDEIVREGAMEALRAVASEEAIDALTDLAFSRNRRKGQRAVQQLAMLPVRRSQAAVEVYEAVIQNDWGSLKAADNAINKVLGILLGSDLFSHWPSAKRKRVLDIALARDIKPSSKKRRELADIGFFVSGLHTINDLLRGVRHRNPAIRIDAADRLGRSGYQWVSRPLYRRFINERESDEPRRVEVAFARALIRLDDERPIDHYRGQMAASAESQALEAARALADIGMPESTAALFRFAVEPPSAAAARRAPMAFSALADMGDAGVDMLMTFMDHPASEVRMQLLELIKRTKHAQSAALFAQMSRDPYFDVQRAALEALASLNSDEAAQALVELLEDETMPRALVTRTLTQITHRLGPKYVRELLPDVTTIDGVVFDDNNEPLTEAFVQVVRKVGAGNLAADWEAISPRATTDQEGRFWLSAPELEERRPYLKVTRPPQQTGETGDDFRQDFRARPGDHHHLEVQLDRFFDRMQIYVEWLSDE